VEPVLILELLNKTIDQPTDQQTNKLPISKLKIASYIS